MYWCWVLSPTKRLCSRRATEVCIRAQKHRAPPWRLFPRQEEKEQGRVGWKAVEQTVVGTGMAFSWRLGILTHPRAAYIEFLLLWES